jgi:hypothetical protein
MNNDNIESVKTTNAPTPLESQQDIDNGGAQDTNLDSQVSF